MKPDSLDDIERDLRSSFEEFLRADGRGYTSASCGAAAQHFVVRFEKVMHEFAYTEARRLTNLI